MMKKLLYFVFICTITFGFIACGSDDKEEVEPPAPIEKFTWDGDWNDPEDTKNYKAEYNGLYNPIVGVWQYEINPKRGFQFNEDFTFNVLEINEDNIYITISTYDYKINGSAFLYDYNLCYRYKLENSSLYVAIQSFGGTLNTEWNKMKRIK